MKTALKGLKVIDLTRVRAGPSAVRHFADWGADVIKVELPNISNSDIDLGGARHGSDFQTYTVIKEVLLLILKIKKEKF